MISNAPLEGVGVLVTRPAAQAGTLCELIEQQGGTAFRFPVLEIVKPADPQAVTRFSERLDTFDWAFFVSANAVNMALPVILERRAWPESVRIAVIGKRSAEELQRFGLEADLLPQRRFDSEGLLAMPPMQQVNGQRCVIFRGGGSRDLLASTLRERGARVEYVEAYRRIHPHADSSAVLARWRAGQINIVLVNSVESLKNLAEMLGSAGKSLLMATPLLVVSERLAVAARQLGFEKPPLVADSATDTAVLEALLVWQNLKEIQE
ncbi:MAG: uroporphyrinogen-III synthase [Gammaproteobacteria bacterium]|nr:MAG: uroporphyrinogen-III synthase [Gammaproteobacteria bacterium]